MNSPKKPKAFLSHASEDKLRFVTSFAEQLCERGVDVWYDQWEIQAGDSLVDKIFEDGIKGADAFIVVLSRVSVAKPWVREELDSAVVRRIKKSCRLIPVILDDCQVPTALEHLAWIRIENLDEYGTELQRISNAIFGATDKPPVSEAPGVSRTQAINYAPGLTKADNLVFSSLCRCYLESGNRSADIENEMSQFQELGLSAEETQESLEMLTKHGYLDSRNSASAFDTDLGRYIIVHVCVPYRALAGYLRKTIPEYQDHVLTAAAAIVNHRCRERADFDTRISFSGEILEVIVRDFEARGFLEVCSGSNGQFYSVESRSPELKRLLGA